MPLQKLQLRPGINRENTSYANEGGYYASDKIRFRSGQPEKVGGWQRDTGTVSPNISVVSSYGTAVSTTMPAAPSGTLWGICRSMWNWVTLSGRNLLSFCTNLKVYIQDGVNGMYYDVTPIRKTSSAVANAFTTTNGSNVVVVNDPGHGAQTGDFVTITGTSGAVNGIPAAALGTNASPVMYQITYITNNTYSITTSVSATSSGTPAVSATFTYELTTGNDVYTVATGWGAGGWGGATTGYPSTGWGLAAAAGGIGVFLRFWSQSNFGENLLFNPNGGGIYLWAVNATPTIFDRAQLLSAGVAVTVKNAAGTGSTTVTPDSTCPSAVNYMMVSDSSRFVIAFGTNDPTGVYATTSIDPMQIRWSDQESFTVWTPAATNQAGDYRLSHGSSIITAIQSRQEILVFTDSAVYSMQYTGAPYYWTFQLLEDNISIMGPNAVEIAANVVYWMGMDKFYVYTGRVQAMPSTLREYVFTDINLNQGFQVNAGTNEGYNEVWWTYCSANSNVTDRYVIYNYVDNVWYYGTWDNYAGVPQGRTYWLDSALRSTPMSASYGAPTLTSSRTSGSTTLNYQETGTDDGSNAVTTPIVAYVQSSDFDIGDGHNFGFVWRMIPDLTFDGSFVNQPSANFTLLPRTFPGAAYGPANNPYVTSTQNYVGQRTYAVQQFTEQVYVRIRGRQMSFKVSSGVLNSATEGLGVQWQLGVPRIDIKPDGRR